MNNHNNKVKKGKKSQVNSEIIIKREDIINNPQNEEHHYFSERFRANLTLRLMEKASSINPKSSRNNKYFDFHKINGDINLRSRRAGDKFNPLGIKGSKKLKDIFIDLKIPREKREVLPLLCFGEDIAWIVGYKISDKYKVDENTTRILQINIEREEIK